MSKGFFRIVLEVEDERAFRHAWTYRDWEDEINDGNVRFRVLLVEHSDVLKPTDRDSGDRPSVGWPDDPNYGAKNPTSGEQK